MTAARAPGLARRCGGTNLFSGFFDDLQPQPPPPQPHPPSPPQPPQPQLPPFRPPPPLPPLAPGVVVVRTVENIRSALTAATTTVVLFLPSASQLDLHGEALVVPAGVNATLSSGEAAATLHGGWRSRVFEVYGSLTLNRLHLTGGLAPPGTVGAQFSGGGAIAVGAGGSLLLLDGTVSSSTTNATAVAALALPDSDTSTDYSYDVSGFIADAHTTGEHGGGIAVAAGGSAVLVRSTLRNLSAPVGGAISTAGRATVRQCAVTDVSAIFGGGIAVTSAGELVLLEASISETRATTANAGVVCVFEAAGTAVMSNCSISNSHAERDAGVVQISGCATILGCVFTNSSAGRNAGVMRILGTATISSCSFGNNSAGRDRGAMSLEGSATIRDCTFTNSSAARVRELRLSHLMPPVSNGTQAEATHADAAPCRSRSSLASRSLPISARAMRT